MKAIALSALLATSLGASAVLAAAPAGAPADSHGLCNDGSYSSNAEKKGARRATRGSRSGMARPRDLPRAQTRRRRPP